MKRDMVLQRQIYLLEKDTGTLCRLLGLYAARGIEVTHVHYEHAAPRTMKLVVTAGAGEDMLRVLVDKASSVFGVIEAARQPA